MGPSIKDMRSNLVVFRPPPPPNLASPLTLYTFKQYNDFIKTIDSCFLLDPLPPP